MNNKAKGSQFERDMAKKLSLWLSDGERDDLLWRSHSSGGRATQRQNAGLDTEGQHGDLTSTSDLGKKLIDRYSIELKRIKDIDFLNVICGRTNALTGYLEQTVNQADLASTDGNIVMPMLIVKIDRKPELMFVPDDVGFMFFPDTDDEWVSAKRLFMFPHKDIRWVAYPLDDVLKHKPYFLEDEND